MKIKGILFDKDGTLIDFFSVWETAARRVVERLCESRGISWRQPKLLSALGIEENGIDPEGALAWKSYEGIAKDLAPLLEAEPRELAGELNRLFYEEVALTRTEYPVFTDVKNMIKALKEQGVQTGLATTDELSSTKKCMEILGIADEISFWGTAGTGLPEKPDGRLIELAAEQWNLHPAELAVVGDTPNDMRFARNGGAVGIAVRSGVASEAELLPQAAYVIDSVAELEALIKERNGKEDNNGSH